MDAQRRPRTRSFDAIEAQKLAAAADAGRSGSRKGSKGSGKDRSTAFDDSDASDAGEVVPRRRIDSDDEATMQEKRSKKDKKDKKDKKEKKEKKRAREADVEHDADSVDEKLSRSRDKADKDKKRSKKSSGSVDDDGDDEVVTVTVETGTTVDEV